MLPSSLYNRNALGSLPTTRELDTRIAFKLFPPSLASFLMGRWMKPEVYPLVGAMAFVTSMVVFQLSRNVVRNPDVRISKSDRKEAVLDNANIGEKYVDHGLRRFLTTRPPEVMPTINRFFSGRN